MKPLLFQEGVSGAEAGVSSVLLHTRAGGKYNSSYTNNLQCGSRNLDPDRSIPDHRKYTTRGRDGEVSL